MATQAILADSINHPCQHSLHSHSCQHSLPTRLFLQSLVSCEGQMDNKMMKDSNPTNNPAGTAAPGGRQLLQPPQRPTINTAWARSTTPMLSYAAVAAGSRSPSTASATNTTGSGLYTPATSLITPLTASSQLATGVIENALTTIKPSWETALSKKTELKPDAPPFVTQKPTIPAVQMPPMTRPRSPRGFGWQFGSLPPTEDLATPKAAGNGDGVLTNTSKQINKTDPSSGGTYPYNKQDSTKHSVVTQGQNYNVLPSSYGLVQQPFGVWNIAAEQAPLPRPQNVMVYSAATPAYASNAPQSHADNAPRSHAGNAPQSHAGNTTQSHAGNSTQSHTGNATQSYTTPNRAPVRGSDGGITNPYGSGEGPNKNKTPNVDDASEFSVLTSDYTKDKPHLHGTSPALWEERPHRESFKQMARLNEKTLTEAMPHGRRYIDGMNPPSYKMELGTRVLCIKTEDLANIHASLANMVWAAPERIGQRINRVWDARRSSKESVLLLFSINGQKCYCGMAIMRGLWEASDIPEGFTTSVSEKVPEGCLPIEWKFLKNVSYDHFLGISHPGHNQPIVNMWSGMHFPYEQGRQVIETYVKTPHFTNVLVYRQDQQYNPYKEIRHGAQLDPTLRDRSTRPVPGTPTARGRGAARGNQHGQRMLPASSAQPQGTQGTAPGNWNQNAQVTQGGQPAPAIHHQVSTAMVRSNTSVHTATPATFAGMTQPVHKPGTLFMANEHGALVPYTAMAPSSSLKPAFEGNRGHSMAQAPQQTRTWNPPAQPAQFPNHPRGRGHNRVLSSYRGGYSSGPRDAPPQPFINVDNARMQQFHPRGGMNNSMHHADPFHSGSGDYIQPPPGFGNPNARPSMPLGYAMRYAALTRDNLRAMHSTSNLRPDPAVAQNFGPNDRALRHVASASQVMMPPPRAPGPYTPGAPSEIPRPPTDQTASPLTTIPRAETESPAPQRRVDDGERELIHTLGRVVMGMMKKYPLEGGVELPAVEEKEEDDDVFSDNEEGGVALP